jgi:hemin uptake protein HemP
VLLTVKSGQGKIIIGHRGKQKHLRKAEKDPLTFEK